MHDNFFSILSVDAQTTGAYTVTRDKGTPTAHYRGYDITMPTADEFTVTRDGDPIARGYNNGVAIVAFFAAIGIDARADSLDAIIDRYDAMRSVTTDHTPEGPVALRFHHDDGDWDVFRRADQGHGANEEHPALYVIHRMRRTGRLAGTETDPTGERDGESFGIRESDLRNALSPLGPHKPDKPAPYVQAEAIIAAARRTAA